ncbi:hypothetical protein [Paracoccus sp. IB05]|uniref:hypothetical protein n=1 Tax=Paracoccus sp. IB05 TaxID=2779367 RepID=UPI0018E71894|nr:hypothetical protein [Paracoccus sp. IB05]MBJ2150597.1 hypothetical protein [Paracoccus sp. IB05]
MRIWYDPADGRILCTLTGTPDLPGEYIETGLTAEDLGDLTGWAVIGGELVRISLEPLRQEARVALTAAITRARAGLITALPGQDMIYLAKEAEARAWVAATDPDLATFPLLSAETGITAPDPDQLAQLWLNMADLWRSAAAGLEALRLSTQAAIAAAGSPEDITAALAALTPQES